MLAAQVPDCVNYVCEMLVGLSIRKNIKPEVLGGLYEGPRDLYFSYRQSNQLLRSLLPD